MKTAMSLVLFAALLFAIDASAQSVFKTYTTLSGYYDYQTNGAACQYVRVNPINGQLHAIFMNASDSMNISSSRRTVYAFSTNAGVSWNNFASVTIPARRSGFPAMDLWKTRSGTCLAIANHGTLDITVYLSCTPGLFDELLPPQPGLTQEPLFAALAGTSDSGLVLVGSISNRAYVRRYDLGNQWQEIPCAVSNGRYTAAANADNRAGVLLNTVGGGMRWFESTNNGITWPQTCRQIHDSIRVAGADTFQCWVGADAVYAGDSITVALNEIKTNAIATSDGAQIVFWSGEHGYRVVATQADIPDGARQLNKRQVNYFTLGDPSIGVSGSTIVIAFTAFRTDTSASGFNYGEIYYSYSTNNGQTWSSPANLTNTRLLDERYPSVAKWNVNGSVNIVWQEDTQPGSSASSDGAPISRSRQVFCHISDFVLDANTKSSLPSEFALEQNYPNPFNPTTRIEYTIPQTAHVSLKVFDVLGREVATLVDEVQGSGFKNVEFDASGLASGVYYYQLRAGEFLETKQMILMR